MNPTGSKIRTLRIKLGLTQQKLAELSGVARPNISALECGRLSLGLDRAELLAKVLGVHPQELLWPNWKLENKGVGR